MLWEGPKPVCYRASPLVGTDCCVWKPLYYGDEGHSEQHLGSEDAVHDLENSSSLVTFSGSSWVNTGVTLLR